MADIAIFYVSVHHKNTEKLLKNMCSGLEIDLYNILENPDVDISKYKVFGLASGIYKSDYHKKVYEFLEKNINLPKVSFLIYTSGIGGKNYYKKVEKFLNEKEIKNIGVFQTKGYDTFGILKYIGGISKKHPNENDILKGKTFILDILNIIKNK